MATSRVDEALRKAVQHAKAALPLRPPTMPEHEDEQAHQETQARRLGTDRRPAQ